MDEKVETLTRADRPMCTVANGILICNCGICKQEDYKLPKDFNITKRVVGGKEYTIHMLSDPAEENMCDGCQ